MISRARWVLLIFLLAPLSLFVTGRGRAVGDETVDGCPVGTERWVVTKQINVSSGGLPANGTTSYTPVLSADGRYILFDSTADNLVEGDTNSKRDLFIHDVFSGMTERVSVASDGRQADDEGTISSSSMSADGRFVVFISFATNLIPGRTLPGRQIYLRDRVQGVTELISVAPDGTSPANALSDQVAVSPEGNYVAFISAATNLVEGLSTQLRRLFIRDRHHGRTDVADIRGNDGHEARIAASRLLMTDNGHTIAFDTRDGFLERDENNAMDVFIYPYHRGPTTSAEAVSLRPDGSFPNASSYISGGFHGLSADGRYVAFYSQDSDLVSIPGANYYVRDLVAGTTMRPEIEWVYNVVVPREAGRNSFGLPYLSHDGDWVIFSTDTQLLPLPPGAPSLNSVLRERRFVYLARRVRDDTDGVCGTIDNCSSVPNPNQIDADFDGVGDECDTCPYFPNPGELQTLDTDGDHHPDLCDLCPATASFWNEDHDGDGIGDACDFCQTQSNTFEENVDTDQDGRGDFCDNCPGQANAGQEDADRDNNGDACDNCVETRNPDQKDREHDGIGDACDSCPDHLGQNQVNGQCASDSGCCCQVRRLQIGPCTSERWMVSDPNGNSIPLCPVQSAQEIYWPVCPPR